ncbi:MAG: 23S rRNA (uracil(1939)-C(5))-methyltransferase RlmD [Bacteroidota bacterium]
MSDIISEEPSQQIPSLKKGEEVTLHADSAAFEGGCVARHNGMAVFVTGCVPGDTVRAMITKKRKRHAEARTLEVLEPSDVRVEPPCIYFGDCGGCKWQNLAYAEQLRWKRQHVEDAFQRIAGLEGVEVRPAIGCAEEYFYRNKMEFSFGDQRWLTAREIGTGLEMNRDFALGLHVPGRYDKVLDVHKCWLQSELSNNILNATRDFALERGLSIYNTRTHEGLLRNLVIRLSRASAEIMVILVTSDDADDVITDYAAMLRVAVPEVTTLVQGVNRKKAQIAFSEETRVLYGPGTITETVAGNAFSISPFSFFQTNSLQADRLYREALAAAELNAGQHVWDLYCGAGTITLAAARSVASAVGIEINPVSIDDARVNAVRNGIANAGFIAGDLKDVMLRRGTDDAANALLAARPDVIITDPPRAGMHEDVVRAMLEVAPERIAYVSCNPATQARDCAILAELYTVEYVQPVDMFPQTYHVETVARLVRK